MGPVRKVVDGSIQHFLQKLSISNIWL